MKLLVEDVEVDVEVDVAVAVVLVVSPVTLLMMRTHLLPLLVKVLLKETLEIPQKGLVMVGLVVLIVVIVEAVEVSAMEKVVKMGAHEEYLNVAVGLDAGECYTED